MLKQFDEGRNDYTGEFVFDDVSEFVQKYRFATVMEFDDDVRDLIFSSGATKMAMILFGDVEEEEGQNALKAL